MIEIGNYIRLRNSTAVEELIKCEEWNDLYLTVSQFQHVCLWFPTLNCRGEQAKMFFESSVSKIIAVENDASGNPLFVTTELFWIILPNAIANNEIEILTTKPESILGFDEDKSTIEFLEFFELSYKKGLFDVLERENNKHDVYKREFHQMRKSGKWDHLTKQSRP